MTEEQLRKTLEEFNASSLAPKVVKVEVKKEGRGFVIRIRDANG